MKQETMISTVGSISKEREKGSAWFVIISESSGATKELKKT